MIAVRLEGRLGNQLFQYAFAYATANKLGKSFYLDRTFTDLLPATYFEVAPDAFSMVDNKLFGIKGYKNFFKVHLRKRFYIMLQLLLLKHDPIVAHNDEAPEVILPQLNNRRMYEGYFQSERYFEHVAKDIRRLYTIKIEFREKFDTLIASLNIHNKVAVVHIRRGDYTDLNISLPLDYYKKALEQISIADYHMFFISDDPAYVEQVFSDMPNKYVSKHDEITDLQFLMHADVCVLSNSSFSWWGAWLNTKPDKIVFAPENWLGYGTDKEYPKGISYKQQINWIAA